MSKPLDELYLEWLYRQVASLRLKNPARTYWSLARQLYTTEFVWIIPNDDNRVEDGRDLRYEFIEECDIQDVDDEWLSLGCSMLEMLIALARRLSFVMDGEPRAWFWEMMENLRISEFSDKNYEEGSSSERQVKDILDEVIWRTYRPDGTGGLFPLRSTRRSEDQTNVEIWYQMHTYISDHH